MHELIEQAKAGNRDAFYKVFQPFEQDIYKMAFVYVNNANEAMDIVQETAYRSFKSIHSLKDYQYVKTWLIRIAINSSIDYLRKKNKLILLDQNEYNQYLPAEETNVALDITLHELINKLDAMEKSMIMLKYFEDFTFQEAADILNIPLGTAKSILYRAIQTLRKDLNKEDFYE